jgi:hypothetical protein
MVVKTYKGMLTHDTEDRIRLSTIRGKVGYRIVKFELMQSTLTASDQVSFVKIVKSPYTRTSSIDFTDSDILAVGIIRTGNLLTEGNLDNPIIFDNEIFNQDIYINLKNLDGTLSVNYYIELEVIPLDDGGAEYTTLKDMRQRGVS